MRVAIRMAQFFARDSITILIPQPIRILILQQPVRITRSTPNKKNNVDLGKSNSVNKRKTNKVRFARIKKYLASISRNKISITIFHAVLLNLSNLRRIPVQK